MLANIKNSIQHHAVMVLLWILEKVDGECIDTIIKYEASDMIDAVLADPVKRAALLCLIIAELSDNQEGAEDGTVH